MYRYNSPYISGQKGITGTPTVCLQLFWELLRIYLNEQKSWSTSRGEAATQAAPSELDESSELTAVLSLPLSPSGRRRDVSARGMLLANLWKEALHGCLLLLYALLIYVVAVQAELKIKARTHTERRFGRIYNNTYSSSNNLSALGSTLNSSSSSSTHPTHRVSTSCCALGCMHTYIRETNAHRDVLLRYAYIYSRPSLVWNDDGCRDDWINEHEVECHASFFLKSKLKKNENETRVHIVTGINDSVTTTTVPGTPWVHSR